MILLLDCGIGNVGSVVNMFKKIDVPIEVGSSSDAISSASKIVLPGVGAFDRGMRALKSYDVVEALTQRVVTGGAPFLGVCIGMQLLARGSEEGEVEGLGWLDAHVRKLSPGEWEGQKLRIPHMGWNRVSSKQDDPLLGSFPEPPKFYFLHSYFVECANDDDIVGTADYGVEFTAMVRKDNIWGVQFHPEKSHRYGMQLFRAFADLPE